jgi:alanine dehydrogenase
MGKVLLLSRQDVQSVLTMHDSIEVMKSAFSELAEGTANLPQRTAISVDQHKGVSLYMPAFLPQTGALAVKVVTVYKENPQRHNVPTTLGKVLLQNIETGDVISIMDGGYLTAMRTGAVSGCAMQCLSREVVKTVGLLGAGVQARTQLMAACTARPSIDFCKVYDVNREGAMDLAKEMVEYVNVKFKICKSAEEAVRNSEIILCATSTTDPLFDDAWIDDGTHISGIGSHTPVTREVGTETVIRAKVVCDRISACLAEAGDLIIPIKEGRLKESDIYGELGEIVSGRKPGREDDDEVTFFKSVGLAIQDAAAAKLVYEKAKEKSIGTEVDI